MVSLASISDAVNVWKYENSSLSLTSSFTMTTGRCACLAWNHTNQVVATGGSSHQIHLLQANNGNLLSSLQVSQEGDTMAKLNAVAMSSNSRFLAAALANHVQIWDLKRRQIKTILSDHVQDISSVCFLPTGEVVSGDNGGTVRIWDSQAYLSSPEMTIPSGTLSIAGVTSLSVSPAAGRSLAVGYTDGTLGVWDSVSYQLVRRQVCHSGSLNSLAYSPRNPRLVTTAGSDGRVTLIDTGAKNSTDPSAVIEIPGVDVTTVSFHEDAIHTAVGLSNGKILIYDWRNLRKPVVSTAAREQFPILALSFQVPKTSASGGDSVASSRRSKQASVAAPTPSTAPAAATTSNPNDVPLPAPPSGTTAAAFTVSSSKTYSSTTVAVTDVPVRKVPATPPRVLSHRDHSPASAPVPLPAAINPSVGAQRDTSPTESSLQRRHYNSTDKPVATFVSHASPSSPLKTALGEAQEAVNQQQHLSLPKSQSLPQYDHYKSPESDNKPRSVLKSDTPVRRSDAFASNGNNLEVSFDASVGMGRGVAAHSHTQSPQQHSRAEDRSASMSSLPNSVPPSSSARKHRTPEVSPSLGESSVSGMRRGGEDDSAIGRDAADDSYSVVRNAVKPVTAKDLEDALSLLKYDLHREMQDIIREQIRQFSIAKEETAGMLQDMNAQVADLLRANRELRVENERLRRIY